MAFEFDGKDIEILSKNLIVRELAIIWCQAYF